MEMRSGFKNDCRGFTLIEVIVTCVIIAVLGSIAIGGFTVWLPGYRLKTAARELYSNMQQIKMSAIKNNGNCSITFSASPDQYVTTCVTKTVVLSDYSSGVKFARPSSDPGAVFTLATITFNARGTSNAGTGDYVCLSNEKNTAYYRIWISTTGIIKFEKHVSGTTWQ